MNIFDAHVHLPSPGIDKNLEWAPATPDTKTAIKYLRRCKVGHILASTARGLYAQSEKEIIQANDEIAQLAIQSRYYIEPSCQLNPRFGRGMLDELHRCVQQLGMKCLGEICGYLGGFSYDSTLFRDVIQLATDYGMLIQIHAGNHEEIDRICSDFPKAKIIWPHLGNDPDIIDQRIHLTERHPNLFLDISGQGYQRMGVLEKAVQVAGSDHVIFGSDFVINDPCAVIARVNHSLLVEDDKEKILGENITHLLASTKIK